MPREKVAIKVDPKIFDAYVGKYEINPSLIITISREENRLVGEATGQPKVEFSAESETRFFVGEIGIEITFVKDEKGAVTHLVLRQGGRDTNARKIQ
jgi:hypothetical protein